MSTIDELVHYCKEPDPIGALMLTGDWGSGKTYLIENELTEALGPDYAVVRISLFGISSISALQQKIRKEWISVCYPFVNKIRERKELAQKNSGLFKMLKGVISKLNPVLASTADIIDSMNVVDTIQIEPEFEDFKTQKKRRVIRVFDDMERCNLNITELLGVINECCENQHFHTIVVANLKYLMKTLKGDPTLFLMLKEKAFVQTLVYQPDYVEIIHKIILEKQWRTEEYRQYLLDNEDRIVELFTSEPADADNGHVYEKSHNLLTLIVALRNFYRIYYHLENAGIENISDYMYPFVAYSICSNNGIIRDGQTVYDFSDEEVRILYPLYSGEKLLPSERTWIKTSYFNSDEFRNELKQHTEKE